MGSPRTFQRALDAGAEGREEGRTGETTDGKEGKGRKGKEENGTKEGRKEGREERTASVFQTITIALQ